MNSKKIYKKFTKYKIKQSKNKNKEIKKKIIKKTKKK